MGGQEVLYPLYPVVWQMCIGVYPRDYVAASGVKTGVTRMRYTLPRLSYDSHKREGAGNFDGTVSAVVIHHNNLIRHDSLARNCFEAGFDMVFFVMNWYN